MQGLFRALTLLFALALSTSVSAQHHISAGLLKKIPLETMPLQDNDQLLRQENALRRPGRPNRFAVPIPTSIRPQNQGVWIEDKGISTWYLQLHSPGAKTLNLGFSEYNLPAGAELYITTEDDQLGPFTLADNEDHNQLWTEIVMGDRMLLELRVPTQDAAEVQLYLTYVNHDFEDITKSLSGSCNLDVACSADDGFGIVDNYRDIIRSVGAYTLRGIDQCSGFLINNANQDGTPYFMTANHCQVRSTNAASVVTYWNYESPTCRPPFSEASGGRDTGLRNISNRGAIFLSRATSSDMCLLLLEEPVNPAADAFFAGWSRDPLAPRDTVIAIHHPGVGDKRISFSYNTITRTAENENIPNAQGRYLVVSSWSVGTTEGGSSGSPLFDRFKRVRGQLWRGGASCRNTTFFDQYGFFHSSWDGDGTRVSSIREFLDPCGTDLMEMDGLDSRNFGFSLSTGEFCQESCFDQGVDIDVLVGESFPAGSTASITSSTPGITPSLSTTTVSGGDVLNVIVPGGADLALGTYQIVVTVTGGGQSTDITLSVDLVDPSIGATELLTPTEGSFDVSPITTLTWAALDEAITYDLQISTTNNFTSLVIDEMAITGTELTLRTALDPAQTYFWRVRGNSICGGGDWRASAFRTSNQLCGVFESANTPAIISEVGRPVIDVDLEITQNLTIEDMTLDLQIDHEFIGDISAVLRSPDGTTVEVFDAPLSGSCNGTRMIASFTDAATLTSTDFNRTCDDAAVSIGGRFQPKEAFAAFEGENSVGIWRLTITDGANRDGGVVNNFSIDFCSPELSVFTVSQASPNWASCNGQPSSFVLNLGSGFAAGTELTVSAAGTELPGYTASVDVPNRTATIEFTDYGGLALGINELSIEVRADEENSTLITVPFELVEATVAAIQTSPEDGSRTSSSGDVTFQWDASPGATSYIIELSTTADFTSFDFSLETTETSGEIMNLEPGTEYFWRVVSNNEACGTEVSKSSSFTVATTSVQNFGLDRQIAIYPNPVREWLTIELSGNWTDDVHGTLLDATGRSLRAYQITNSGQVQWDVSGLPQGLYFLRLQAGGRQYTERIMVAR